MRYLLFIIIFASCTNTAVQEELATTKAALNAAQAKITTLQNQIEPEGDLVHVVLFKLKPDADQAALLAEIKKLEAIEEMMDLEVGPFKNLGDARALSDYSMMMQMSFADTTAYQKYQQHPIHFALRENTLQYMAGPPATYDFIKQ